MDICPSCRLLSVASAWRVQNELFSKSTSKHHAEYLSVSIALIRTMLGKEGRKEGRKEKLWVTSDWQPNPFEQVYSYLPGGKGERRIHSRWVDVSYRTIMPGEYLARFTHGVPLIADSRRNNNVWGLKWPQLNFFLTSSRYQVGSSRNCGFWFLGHIVLSLSEEHPTIPLLLFNQNPTSPYTSKDPRHKMWLELACNAKCQSIQITYCTKGSEVMLSWNLSKQRREGLGSYLRGLKDFSRPKTLHIRPPRKTLVCVRCYRRRIEKATEICNNLWESLWMQHMCGVYLTW